MKKMITMIIALMMVVACLAACGGSGNNTTTAAQGGETAAAESDFEYIKNKGTLVVGITEYAPMDYKDENGEWTGFDVEYGQAVAEILGVDLEFVVIDWDNKVNELNSKAVDCIWNGMTINDSVKASMDVTDAYVLNAQVVVMKLDEIANYTDVESLADLSFAVESGSAGQDMADENNLQYTALTAQSDALLEVESNSVQACIIDITMANSMTGEGTSYADLGIAMSLSEEEYGVGCRQGSDLVDQINEATQQLRDNGKLAEIAAKYELTLAE